MKRTRGTLSIMIGLLLSCWACEEIRPISPPKDRPNSSSPCQFTSPIETNIIGTWHFESTYKPSNNAKSGTSGTIQFDSSGAINDPDSLVENQIPAGRVLTKTYKFSENTLGQSGKFIEIRWTTELGGYRITPFIPVSNDCNRIVFRLNGDGYDQKFILTRL